MGTISLSIGVSSAQYLGYPVGVSPLTLAVADFDGDQIYDLAAVAGWQYQEQVELLRGLGGYAYDTPIGLSISDGGRWPVGLVAGDLDQDGAPDVLAFNQWIAPLLNARDGGFVEGPGIPRSSNGNVFAARITPGAGGAFVLVDDSFGDLTLYHYRPPDGGFTFEESQHIGYTAFDIFAPDAGTEIWALAISDDGGVGLSAWVNSGIHLLADPAGDVSTFLWSPPDPGVGFPNARMVDVDGDGIADVVVATPYTPAIEVVRRFVDGGQDHRDYPLPGFRPSFVEVADVTGDALPDIVTVAIGQLAVLANLGDGGFAVPDLYGDGGGQGPCFVDGEPWEPNDLRAIPPDVGSDGGWAIGILDNSYNQVTVLTPQF